MVNGLAENEKCHLQAEGSERPSNCSWCWEGERATLCPLTLLGRTGAGSWADADGHHLSFWKHSGSLEISHHRVSSPSWSPH